MFRKYLILPSLIIFFASPAYAYLDPGLGSLIIQSIIGFAAVALGTISVFWQRVKEIYSKFISFFDKKNPHDNKKN